MLVGNYMLIWQISGFLSKPPSYMYIQMDYEYTSYNVLWWWPSQNKPLQYQSLLQFWQNCQILVATCTCTCCIQYLDGAQYICNSVLHTCTCIIQYVYIQSCTLCTSTWTCTLITHMYSTCIITCTCVCHQYVVLRTRHVHFVIQLYILWALDWTLAVSLFCSTCSAPNYHMIRED